MYETILFLHVKKPSISAEIDGFQFGFSNPVFSMFMSFLAKQGTNRNFSNGKS